MQQFKLPLAQEMYVVTMDIAVVERELKNKIKKTTNTNDDFKRIYSKINAISEEIKQFKQKIEEIKNN